MHNSKQYCPSSLPLVCVSTKPCLQIVFYRLVFHQLPLQRPLTAPFVPCWVSLAPAKSLRAASSNFPSTVHQHRRTDVFQCKKNIKYPAWLNWSQIILDIQVTSQEVGQCRLFSRIPHLTHGSWPMALINFQKGEKYLGFRKSALPTHTDQR